MTLALIWNNGSADGERHEFTRRPRINLGRKSENDIVFGNPEHQMVSGFHAQIRLDGAVWHIQDLGSTHGTWVNGSRITTTTLHSGDVIRLCSDGPELTVELSDMDAVSSNAGPSTPVRTSRIYGQRTVGLMIQRALEAAGLNRLRGTSKPTAYFEAMLEDRLEVTQRRYRMLFILSGTVVALILVIVGILILRHRNVTVNQTTQYVTETAAGGSVASANRHHVFVMAGIPRTAAGSSVQVGFCTAFAVGANLLATNAHCVVTASRDYSTLEVRMNGVPNRTFNVVRMNYHPHYRADMLSPDVAVLQINGTLSSWARIASDSELRQISAGVPVFLYGFPGRLNNLFAPEATFVRGEIGRVTTFAHTVAAFSENTLLQHSAFVSQGTSGSPMFNAAGSVIGVNSGGYSESGQILPGYNIGMRADMLTPLIQSLTNN